MEQIAFIYGETFIYWHSILLTLSVAAAACLFLAFWISRGGSWLAGILAVTVSCVASLVLGRLAHWYFQSAGYESFQSAMTDYSTGDFALMGVFAGCMLTACLLRLLRIHDNLPAMLDCMCLAGAAGIAVGRLSCLYTDADRGMVLKGFTQLPFASAVPDPVSGELTWRLATFMLQAIWTGGVFLILAVFWLTRSKRKYAFRDGDTALLFLMLHGAAQILFDSTRYDSLFMRSNGFVGVVQILGAVALVTTVVTFTAYMLRNRGWRWWYVLLWTGIAGLLGGAGYMEYYVQRHGGEALFAYSVMGLCLAGVLILTLVIRGFSLDYRGKFSVPR